MHDVCRLYYKTITVHTHELHFNMICMCMIHLYSIYINYACVLHCITCACTACTYYMCNICALHCITCQVRHLHHICIVISFALRSHNAQFHIPEHLIICSYNCEYVWNKLRNSGHVINRVASFLMEMSFC